MAIRKSTTQKCKYLQVLPRFHEYVPTITLIHPNFAISVPVADALKTCLVVHASHPHPASLVYDPVARSFHTLSPPEVSLQPCTLVKQGEIEQLLSAKECLNAKKPKVTYPEIPDNPPLQVPALAQRIVGVAVVLPSPSHVSATFRETDNPREMISN